MEAMLAAVQSHNGSAKPADVLQFTETQFNADLTAIMRNMRGKLNHLEKHTAEGVFRYA